MRSNTVASLSIATNSQKQKEQQQHQEVNQCSYKDLSLSRDPKPDSRRNRGGVTEPFPEKLHRMLTYAEQNGLTDTITFFPHGRAFVIHKPKKFSDDIMPRFFRQTRLTSFQRQLNLYGFCRISQGPDNGGYYHELFLRGRPGLCVNMKRTKVKGTGGKTKRNPDTEPNFYEMPPIKAAGSDSPVNGNTMNAVATESTLAGVNVTQPPKNLSIQGSVVGEAVIHPNTFFYPTNTLMAPYTAAQIRFTPPIDGKAIPFPYYYPGIWPTSTNFAAPPGALLAAPIVAGPIPSNHSSTPQAINPTNMKAVNYPKVMIKPGVATSKASKIISSDNACDDKKEVSEAVKGKAAQNVIEKV